MNTETSSTSGTNVGHEAGEQLWTRSFILLLAGTTLLFIAFYMLYPTLPLYIKRLGGNDSEVGAAMGVFMLASVVFRPIVGSLLDRFGRRIFVAGGLLLFGGTMYLYGRGVDGAHWIRGVRARTACRRTYDRNVARLVLRRDSHLLHFRADLRGDGVGDYLNGA